MAAANEISLTDLFDDETCRQFRGAVRAWYRRHGRSLPWRDETDAYRIWIREIMLQQTTVVAVIPYWERFLAAFPDVSALASASEQDVLRHWEGLGYYSRARNLHRAAQVIRDNCEGEFPTELETIRSLPGVGPYTAAAIASFAFQSPVGIVEANTTRLYARLTGCTDDLTKAAPKRLLWDFADRVVSRRQPGRFNQALMDLGATVCTPTEPPCEQCPVVSFCEAFRSGQVAAIPAPKQRAKVTELQEVSIGIFDRGRVLLRQRQEGELWAGLWDFPRGPFKDGSSGHSGVRTKSLEPVISGLFPKSVQFTTEETGLNVEVDAVAPDIKHSVTRYRITLVCLKARLVDDHCEPTNGYVWADLRNLACYPLSKTARIFADRLCAEVSTR